MVQARVTCLGAVLRGVRADTQCVHGSIGQSVSPCLNLCTYEFTTVAWFTCVTFTLCFDSVSTTRRCLDTHQGVHG